MESKSRLRPTNLRIILIRSVQTSEQDPWSMQMSPIVKYQNWDEQCLGYLLFPSNSDRKKSICNRFWFYCSKNSHGIIGQCTSDEVVDRFLNRAEIGLWRKDQWFRRKDLRVEETLAEYLLKSIGIIDVKNRTTRCLKKFIDVSIYRCLRMMALVSIPVGFASWTIDFIQRGMSSIGRDLSYVSHPNVTRILRMWINDVISRVTESNRFRGRLKCITTNDMVIAETISFDSIVDFDRHSRGNVRIDEHVFNGVLEFKTRDRIAIVIVIRLASKWWHVIVESVVRIIRRHTGRWTTCGELWPNGGCIIVRRRLRRLIHVQTRQKTRERCWRVACRCSLTTILPRWKACEVHRGRKVRLAGIHAGWEASERCWCIAGRCRCSGLARIHTRRKAGQRCWVIVGRCGRGRLVRRNAAQTRLGSMVWWRKRIERCTAGRVSNLRKQCRRRLRNRCWTRIHHVCFVVLIVVSWQAR